jgi:predicted RNA-binding Zn ribbon-like protein
VTVRDTRPAPGVGQAPGKLATLQAFVNTLDLEEGTDQLGSPAALANWLAGAGLAAPDATASQADLDQAMTLREALRGVLLSHVSHPPAADAGQPASQLRSIAARLPAGIAVDSHGQITAVPAGTGTAAALTRILLIAAEAATLGTWTRLKACSADDCQWAFYDRSPTRTGCWCSMQICGARSKSRAYRRRAAAQANQQTSPAAGHHNAPEPARRTH